MEHHFNVGIAKEYGVVEAVIINHLFFWIMKNVSNGKHFYDGRWWTYSSLQAFVSFFPYLSIDQIKRIITKLHKDGFIIKGNYNKNHFDRTVWYAFSDKGLKTLDTNGYHLLDDDSSHYGEDEIAISDLAKSPNVYNSNIYSNNNILDNNTYNLKETNSKEFAKKKTTTKQFAKPSVDDVNDFIMLNHFHFTAAAFVDFYESKGWLIGKAKMKDWKAACRTWERKWIENHPNYITNDNSSQNNNGEPPEQSGSLWQS